MIVFQQEERGYTVFLNDMPANKQLSMLEFGYSRIREGVVVGPRIRNDYLLHFVLQVWILPVPVPITHFGKKEYAFSAKSNIATTTAQANGNKFCAKKSLLSSNSFQEVL